MNVGHLIRLQVVQQLPLGGLLLQRAVNEREMTLAQAASEKHRVRLARQEVACASELFEELPPRLRILSFKSMRLQARILHLDQSLFAAHSGESLGEPGPIARQVEQLRMAFAAQSSVANA